MELYPGSLWAKTWTCFPDAQRILSEHLPPRQWNVLILGCGDGKHTIPFLKASHRVVALDDDSAGIYGGMFDFLGEQLTMHGLLANLKRENIPDNQIKIELVDYMNFKTDETFDVVLTSCSWQFRRNWVYPIGDILAKIQSFVAPGGFLVADYMQPHGSKQGLQHYLTPERLAEFFDPDWIFHLNRDDGVIRERHINGEQWHTHRYASLVVQKRAGREL